MKCCLDTNILDWILEDPHGPEMMDAIEHRLVSAILAADNAHEVDRIPDAKADKRERLRALLAANFLPLAPTHVPILGVARLGLARLASPQVVALRKQLLTHGIKGLDANHLINASREQCAIFVTLDKGILNKRAVIKAILPIECQAPEEMLASIKTPRNREAG